MPNHPDDRAAVTQLLHACDRGDTDALSDLFDQVYRRLHAMAQRQMAGERGDHTLQPTALVHEAFLRLFDDAAAAPGTRAMFFATAARAMRQVLIDHARRRGRKKRGGDRQRLPESVLEIATHCDLDSALALEEALLALEAHDEPAARVVELRFFAGLEVAEVAAILQVSTRTVERNWTYARSWLYRALDAGDRADGAR